MSAEISRLAIAALLSCASANAADTPRWMNTALSPDQRADLLNSEVFEVNVPMRSNDIVLITLEATR